MLKYCVNKWERNKERLRPALEKIAREDQWIGYTDLMKLVVEKILNDNEENTEWNAERLAVIDYGSYQGSMLFIVPRDIYQPGPEDVLMTYINYGSCSVCDTLQRAMEQEYEQEVRDLLTICLHLIQNMIHPYKDSYDSTAELDKEV